MRDLDELFAALRESKFRRKFRLNQTDSAYLRERGLEQVLEHGREFIESRLAAARPAKDGRQTPWRGHPIFVAQHATASCCRSCLAKWHRIAAGRALSDEEMKHVLQVLRRWLALQLTDENTRTMSSEKTSVASQQRMLW